CLLLFASSPEGSRCSSRSYSRYGLIPQGNAGEPGRKTQKWQWCAPSVPRKKWWPSKQGNHKPCNRLRLHGARRKCEMQVEKKTRGWKFRICALSGLLLGWAGLCGTAHAQTEVLGGGSGRNQVSGSVMLDGEATPASRVRVDIIALAGGEVACTFTDS